MDKERMEEAAFRSVLLGWVKQQEKHPIPSKETRFVQSRLQSDVAEIKLSLQALEADRVEEVKFRKMMLAWMKYQGKQHVSGGILESGSGAMPHGGTNHSEDVEVVVVEGKSLVPEVTDEVWELESSQLIVEPTASIVETLKNPYASIVMDMKQMGVLFSYPAPAPSKCQARNPDQQVNKVPPIVSATGAADSNTNVVENGIHEEEIDLYAIYIKGLPMTATLDMLGNNEYEEENGNCCQFEDIHVRDLPLPEPPDLRLGHHSKASLEDNTFLKAGVMIENGKFIYYKGSKCNMVLGLVNK